MAKRQIYSSETGAYLRIEEATPQCGETCTRCGECLACNADGCYYGGVWYEHHVWITYDNELVTSLVAHAGSKAEAPKPRTRRGKLVKSDFVYVRGG